MCGGGTGVGVGGSSLLDTIGFLFKQQRLPSEWCFLLHMR